MKQEDVIKTWAERWRSLSAWRAVIPMQLKFEPYKRGFVGIAHSHKGLAKIRLTGKLAHDLATVLHELAHLAAPNSEHHGEHWRKLFVAAAVEALGGPDDYEIDDVNYSELDKQVEDAVRAWLKRTGQADVLRAIGVAP